MQPGFGRRQKNAVRFVGQVLHTSEYANQLIYFIIIRFYIVVSNGPVGANAVMTIPFKIPGPKTQGNASPVVGSSPQHPCAEPFPFGAGFLGVRFAFNIPAPIAGVQIPERAVFCSASPAFGVPGVFELVYFFLRIIHGAGLDQTHAQTRLRQGISSHTPARTGAHDHYIIFLCLFLDLQLFHSNGHLILLNNARQDTTKCLKLNGHF